MDARASVVEEAAADLGLGLVGETGTVAAADAAAYAAIMGDGTTANPGLGNANWQNLIANGLLSAKGYARYDYWASKQATLMRTMDDIVSGALPASTKFAAARYLDGWLTRLNGANGTAPATPAAPGVLTAVTNGGGALPTTSSGAAPRVVHTLVGGTDEYESLPGAEATQVAIAGVNNAYSYQIAGNVPTGVVKVRMYRSPFGASGAPYNWDQDVRVTAGGPYPAILIFQSDSTLRTDYLPPSWLQCVQRPSAAGLFALAYATNPPGGALGAVMQMSASGMLSPNNVVVGSSTKFVGVGNTKQGVVLGSSVITALNTSTYTAGGLQVANNAGLNVQGFAGAMGLQAMCTTALTGTLTPTISYQYYAAATGYGSAQASGSVTPASSFGSPTVGTVISWTIPAGRLILRVTEVSVSSSASSWGYLYEGVFPR